MNGLSKDSKVREKIISPQLGLRRFKATMYNNNVQNSLTAIVLFVRFAFLFSIASFQLLHITSEKKKNRSYYKILVENLDDCTTRPVANLQ